MYNYRYVSAYQVTQLIEEIERVLDYVNNDIGEDIPFTYEIVGSASRGMVTCDSFQNNGYDIDVNIIIKKKEYSPKQIRNMFKLSLDNAIFRGVTSNMNRHCEDSTRVLTIKSVSARNSSIKYSCDFAIVYFSKNGQEYIHYNKPHQRYYWNRQTRGFNNLEERADWLKQNGYWDEVRKIYLHKKNTNIIPEKHSRSLYAETINDLWNRCYNM